MTNNTQLPAEMLHDINMEGQELMANEPDNWWAYKKGSIKYATKLHELQQKYDNILATESGFESKTENVWQNGFASGHDAAMEAVKQEIEQLKRWKEEAAELLNPILDYGQSKEAGIPLGESITAVVLERCKKAKVASDLLTEVLVMNEMWGDLPGEFIKKVKTFLDGTK